MGNYSKIEDVQKHLVAYDFMEIVLVRKVVNPNAIALWDKSGDETVHLFNDQTHPPFNKSKSGNLILTIKAVMRIIGLVLGSLLFFIIHILKNSRMGSQNC